MKLRPYQTGAIESCRSELRAGRNRIVLYAPTGAGKSVIAESLARNAVERGKRVGIVANRIQLINQLSERFTSAGISHGIVQGENTRDTHHKVVICSIQTVARRGMPVVDFLIIDEGHACAGSKDYRKVIQHNSALPIIALTATPFSRGMAKRYPELGDEPLFHSLVVSTTIRELIDDGHLVDCEIYAPKQEPDLSGVRVQRNQFGELDYSERELDKAVDKPDLIGNIVGHWKLLANGKPTICFATSIAHSKHIVEEFEAAGVRARHIDCYVDPEERERALAAFKAGEFTVLSNVALIAEGFDHPAAEVMILARPTRSLIRFIQMAGRILRPFHGKAKGLILDHSGSTHRLGYPTDDLPLHLCDGSMRQAGGRDEKDEPKPKKCAGCGFMKPPRAHACPQCGFAPERQSDVEVGDGELVAVKRGKKAVNKDTKQHVYSQLLFIGRQHNYSKGWVSNQYRAMFGVWPRGLHEVTAAPTQELLNWVKSRAIAYAKRREQGGHHATA